jgi:hypothetical protein
VFPDFPHVQEAAYRVMQVAIQRLIGIASPVLGLVRHFDQHEGQEWLLRRADGSESRSNFQAFEALASLSREDLKSFNTDAISRFVVDMAKKMARQQSEHMFSRICEVVEEAGNRVDAGGELTQDSLLEMFRRKQTEFDPETLQPTGEVIVLHPETFEKIEPRLREWENDPDFRARYDAIMEQKRREWREREANRKLVD